MNVCSEILGNIHSPEWRDKIATVEIDYVPLDQWTAQKSRFLAKSESGVEYPVALRRQTQVVDGDIIAEFPQENKIAVLKLELNPVLVLDLSSLREDSPENIIRRGLELGHAIGNQHWPAVVKGTKIYVPLTVDKTVMLSVMDTHHLEGVAYDFQPGREVIPYMAPHEIRRLFGGASHHVHGLEHPHGEHGHSHGHEHGDKGHVHAHEHDSQPEPADISVSGKKK